MKKNLAIVTVLLLFLSLFVGCGKNASKDVSKLLSFFKAPAETQSKTYFEFFDTVSCIYSYAGDSADLFEKNCSEVSSILNDYHMMMDIYHEYSGLNNLCTVNKLAGGNPVQVDSRLVDFLLYSEELCALTKGEMDVSMGSVLSVWHKARTSETPYLPSKEELKEKAKYIGFDFVEIDKESSTVRLKNSHSSIDVGALGKGYAAECAARYLEEKGVSGYVLNIGGNIRMVGTKSDGSSWKTGIKDPKNPDSILVSIQLSDTSCVTSGTYERFFTLGGVNYPHIIDKDTLFPARFFDSVSVITKNSGLADALSTAIFCMPYEEGRTLVEGLEGVDCVWIFPDGRIESTNDLEVKKI